VGRCCLPIILVVLLAGCQPGARPERDSAVVAFASTLRADGPTLLSNIGAGSPAGAAQTPVVADSPIGEK